MDSTSDIARRYARQRPGYELVSYREVALPLFRVELQVLVLDEKRVPPIQEFVLRAVEKGVNDLATISSVLGLEDQVVRSAAVELMHSDELVLRGGLGMDKRHVLGLTRKGEQTVESVERTQAVDAEIHVFIDGLTRNVVSVTGKGLKAFPAGRAEDRGLVPIPPHPRKRPELPEILFEDVSEIIAAERQGRRSRRELIGITGMGKARRFAREGLALAFRSEKTGEMQINLVIDGKLSEAHEAALSRAQQYAGKGPKPAKWVAAMDVIADELPAEVIDQAPPAEETDALAIERAEAEEQQRTLRVASDGTTRQELEAVQAKLGEAEKRERELLARILEISVRHLPVYEHPGYFDTALRDAKQRVLIVSPWIKADVVDQQLITRLRRLLDRGVELWIGYGFGEDKPDRNPKRARRNKEALKALQRLADQYDSFRLARFGDTHAKVLVCDSRFSIVTSFNWLSFRGDRKLDFRDERGMYVGIPEKVDALFESYRGRFPGGA